MNSQMLGMVLLLCLVPMCLSRCPPICDEGEIPDPDFPGKGHGGSNPPGQDRGDGFPGKGHGTGL